LNRKQNALIEKYQLFCPNADPYGLYGDRLATVDLASVNSKLERLSVGLRTFPDAFRIKWLSPDNGQPEACQDDLASRVKLLSLEEPNQNEHSCQNEHPSQNDMPDDEISASIGLHHRSI
jgi:hypothetical protein